MAGLKKKKLDENIQYPEYNVQKKAPDASIRTETDYIKPETFMSVVKDRWQNGELDKR